MERPKVQVAALMESQQRVAGDVKGPGGGSNAPACVPCLRSCLGWGRCPRKHSGLIKVVLGQLRQAEIPQMQVRSAAKDGSTTRRVDSGRPPSAKSSPDVSARGLEQHAAVGPRPPLKAGP